MSLRELNSLAPWRWDRSKKPVGDASLRDFAEVNRIIPSLMKGNVDAAKAAEELATHAPSKRRLSSKDSPAIGGGYQRQAGPKSTPAHFKGRNSHPRLHPQRPPSDDPTPVPTPGVPTLPLSRQLSAPSSCPRGSCPPPTPLAALARHNRGSSDGSGAAFAAAAAACLQTPMVPTPALGATAAGAAAPGGDTPMTAPPVPSWNADRWEGGGSGSGRRNAAGGWGSGDNSPAGSDPAPQRSSAAAAALKAARALSGGGAAPPAGAPEHLRAVAAAAAAVSVTPTGLLPAKLRSKASRGGGAATAVVAVGKGAREPMGAATAAASPEVEEGRRDPKGDGDVQSHATLQDLLAAAAAAGEGGRGSEVLAESGEVVEAGTNDQWIGDGEEGPGVGRQGSDELMMLAAAASAGGTPMCSTPQQQPGADEAHAEPLAATRPYEVCMSTPAAKPASQAPQQQQHVGGPLMCTPVAARAPSGGCSSFSTPAPGAGSKQQLPTVRLSPLTCLNVVTTSGGKKQQLLQQRDRAGQAGSSPGDAAGRHHPRGVTGVTSDAAAAGPQVTPARRMHPGQEQLWLQHHQWQLQQQQMAAVGAAPAAAATVAAAAATAACSLLASPPVVQRAPAPPVRPSAESSTGPFSPGAAQAPAAAAAAAVVAPQQQRKRHEESLPQPAQRVARQRQQEERSQALGSGCVPYNPVLVPNLFKGSAPQPSPQAPPPPPSQNEQEQQQQQPAAPPQALSGPVAAALAAAAAQAAAAAAPAAVPLAIAPLSVPPPPSSNQCWQMALAQPWIVQTEARRAALVLMLARAAMQFTPDASAPLQPHQQQLLLSQQELARRELLAVGAVAGGRKRNGQAVGGKRAAAEAAAGGCTRGAKKVHWG